MLRCEKMLDEHRTAYDTLNVQVRNSFGTVLSPLHTYSNLDKGTSCVQRSFDLSAYKGQTVQLYMVGTVGSKTVSTFVIDNGMLKHKLPRNRPATHTDGSPGVAGSRVCQHARPCD